MAETVVKDLLLIGEVRDYATIKLCSESGANCLHVGDVITYHCSVTLTLQDARQRANA